jgi:NADPH:quinone reductase-like Zn-dependent oxidoreductase
MRAIQFDSFGDPSRVSRCAELPEPDPPQGDEVLVRMLVMSINPADLLTIEGRYGAAIDLPYIPGAEGVGRVEAVGEAVKDLVPGTLVIPLGRGCWRELMLGRRAEVVPLPDGIPVEQAAMLKVNPATARLLLRSIVDAKPGDWVLQNAANSAVGCCLVQTAKSQGIKTLNIIRRANVSESLEAIGADAVIVDDGSDPDRLSAAVREVTSGATIELGIDAIAGPATNAMASALSDRATIANYGLLSGKPCEIDPQHLVFRGLTLRGFWLAAWMRAASSKDLQAMYAELANDVAADRLHTAVEARYPLEDVAEALAHAGRSGRDGKILLTA